ncbi:MAG: glutamate formimidoyltransferase [Phototrophicaceae bacterium]
MTKLIECVPNFSEGRRQDVIDTIADAIATVADVNLLHVTSDYDHNRTVMTFAGSPEGVMRAAYNAIKIASELIDMTQHSGVHPRIGATDVVPFIPLEGATMDDCIEISRELGQKVADELNLPVYLYEYASIRPERKSLAIIRRGQYETLVNSITELDRQPDYGKPVMGSAGAVTIGARKALIAYNVYLTTDDVTIAQKIARSIRGSSGGLRGVKALGLLVKGRAQVSMNLVDYQNTPIYRVMELIRLEASKLGVQIYESELIGLMPQDALIQSARWYLQLPQLSDSDILENQLNSSKK